MGKCSKTCFNSAPNARASFGKIRCSPPFATCSISFTPLTTDGIKNNVITKEIVRPTTIIVVKLRRPSCTSLLRKKTTISVFTAARAVVNIDRKVPRPCWRRTRLATITASLTIRPSEIATFVSEQSRTLSLKRQQKTSVIVTPIVRSAITRKRHPNP